MKTAMMRFLLKGSLLLTALMAGLLEARELPPADAKPPSEILQAVEARHTGAITEVEFDEGHWGIKVCENRTCLQLLLDPRTGEERGRRTDRCEDSLPPRNRRPLSEIVRALETRGAGVIVEIEFDDGYWEVELRKDGRKTKLDVHPRTGRARR